MSRTFMKERQINNRFIDLLNKQRIIVPPILDMRNYSDFCKRLLRKNCVAVITSKNFQVHEIIKYLKYLNFRGSLILRGKKNAFLGLKFCEQVIFPKFRENLDL